MHRSKLNRPILVLLYGYPGVGKTFFSRQFSDAVGAIHVNAEQLRQEFFENPTYSKQENSAVDHLMMYMTERFLSAGTSVVFDVNAAKLKTRQLLRSLAAQYKVDTILIWVQLDIESAFTRVASRDRRKADDKYAAPLDRTTFESLVSQMQNPSRTENYTVVSGKHTFYTQRDTAYKKLIENGILSLDSSPLKLAKPELVNRVPSPFVGRVDPSRRNITIR